MFYVIEKGHRLWALAKRVYGDGNAYPLIFEANREVIKDPDLIFVGQKIRIPRAVPAPPSPADGHPLQAFMHGPGGPGLHLSGVTPQTPGSGPPIKSPWPPSSPRHTGPR
jgi:hypothetical protein